ncbi:TraR/DksA C4-type zinc finger protein [Patescibacteria group bacterium]|nr:TraR/DksA C4-type zinc finger protein [Patescibacteria group bacterium]MBU1029122.1 TraR/DksA C4-type zinc finger protein [Patescibacteria group bacterium]
MNKDFLNEMKQLLTEERERLESELAQISTKNPSAEGDFKADFPNIGDKEDENAEEVATYSTNLTLERTLESSLRDVESALQRFEGGTYGTCKYCGQEIVEKRLRARPASSSCIECKKNFKMEA